MQYSAFQEGHSGDWSNLQTPPADSKLHYWGCKKICFFQDTELPDATLTMAANSSWKAGANIRFKEINLFTGRRFGLWGSNSQRKMKADRFNILRSNDDAGKFATVYVGSSFTYTIDAEITGYGALNLENVNDQKCTFVLPHLNTNFHGRLLFSQAPNGSDLMTPFQTQCRISDARNLGGEYTVSDDCYNAIEFLDQPCLFVTDDVAFTEPTRGMYINKGARFDVAAGKRMTLANQVTYGGVLEKTGTGTLDLAGMCRFIDGRPESLPVNGSNELHVAVGSLKISSKTAADGLSVIFAEGTRFVVPANSQAGYFNVKWNNPLVINTDDGKLPVEIEIHEDMGDDDSETTICTFNAQAAENVPVSAFKLGRLSGGLRVKSFAKKTVADGNVAYVATIGRVGTQVILR